MFVELFQLSYPALKLHLLRIVRKFTEQYCIHWLWALLVTHFQSADRISLLPPLHVCAISSPTTIILNRFKKKSTL